MPKPGSEDIGVILYSIFQTAIAGGFSEDKAEKIHSEVMSSIQKLGQNSKGQWAFEEIRDYLKDKLFNEVGPS